MIKYFTSIEDLKQTCIKNNISLFLFKYLMYDYEKTNYDLSKKYPILYLTIWEKNILIGVLKQSVIIKYNLDKENSSIRFINYITVNSEYRKQGYGTLLIKKYFEFLNENKIFNLNLSPFSKDGFMYLKNKIIFLSKEYNIKINNDYYCFES